MKFTLLPLMLLLICLPVAADQNNNEIERSNSAIKESRYVMGSILEIILVPPPGENSTEKNSQSIARNILDDAFAIVEKFDKILSNYSASSELSLFNRTGKLVNPSAEFINFLNQTQLLVQLTDGRFDPTIRPLVSLWQEAKVANKPPSDSALLAARRCIGRWPTLESDGWLTTPCAGLQIESGGIGKGYAVDRVIDYLKRRGVSSALVHFGHSSTYALGNAPSGEPWRLLIQFGDEAPLGELVIRDLALSASDSMGQQFTIGEKIFGHIIDPSTGIPLSTKKQALAVSKSASSAEALSKYLLLLPNTTGLETEKDSNQLALVWKLQNDLGQTEFPNSKSCREIGSCVEFRNNN